jgi:hypothetical protein
MYGFEKKRKEAADKEGNKKPCKVNALMVVEVLSFFGVNFELGFFPSSS